jgi:hypothetical protein
MVEICEFHRECNADPTTQAHLDFQGANPNFTLTPELF